MAEKKRVRMRGVKHTSKKLEDEFLERSKALADDPGLIRPQCAGNCRKCVFDKTFKTIDGLHKIKNNPDALLKEASHFGGDDIVKAYAGTISLAAAGSVPLLGTAKIGMDKVSYAVRGTVKADKLIGCQYYTDPKLRIFLYNDAIKKNKLYLYSFGDCPVCSDKPNMPEDYLYDTFWETPYEFPNDELECGHDASAVLEIHIKSLGKDIRICENCARPVSSLQYIISRLATNDPMDDITVAVRHKFHAPGEKDTEDITGDTLKKYSLGAITDSGLIESVKRSKQGAFLDNAVGVYVVGSKNYGSDLDSFLGDLSGTELEMEVLRNFLSKNPRPVMLKSPRGSEALNALWASDWKAIITNESDAKTAEAMGDRSRAKPQDTIQEARDLKLSADVIAKLPEFKRPGPMTQAADKMAKAYMAGGTDMLVRTANGIGVKDSHTRVLCAAFVQSVGEKAPWIKLSQSEQEFADYLVPFVKRLSHAQPEQYRDLMNTLLTAVQSGEKV